MFKTPPDDRIVVGRLYQHLKAAGSSRIAMVSSQDAFGDGGRKELLAQARPKAFEIVFDEKYTMEDADLSPLLNKIKRTQCPGGDELVLVARAGDHDHQLPPGRP